MCNIRDSGNDFFDNSIINLKKLETMEKKKEYKAFAFMGKRGGVTLKKRYEITQKKDFNDFKISFNKGKPIHVRKFKNRWVAFYAFSAPITKQMAKEEILQSLKEPIC